MNSKRVSITLASVLLLMCRTAFAESPFGFTFGMSKQAVEQATLKMELGASKWLGETLLVQAQDDSRHSYLFNFCEGRLYEVSQAFPRSHERMANFVDDSISKYGQPMFVSAIGAMTQDGFLRPINFYWRVASKTYLRLMLLDRQYSIVWQTENACAKIPN